MKNTMTVRPVLLSCKETSSIWSYKSRKLRYNEANFNDEDDIKYYRLFLIAVSTNDKFEVGDTVTDGIIVFQASSKVTDAQDLFNRREWSKVVATQEQLSNEYIQKFVDEYNDGYKINEIEIVIVHDYPVEADDSSTFTIKPKLVDGCVVIVNKYPIGSYAPGNYTCSCITCKSEFVGDKRAVQCEQCAIAMTHELRYSTDDVLDIIQYTKHLQYMNGSKPQNEFTAKDILTSYTITSNK